MRMIFGKEFSLDEDDPAFDGFLHDAKILIDGYKICAIIKYDDATQDYSNNVVILTIDNLSIDMYYRTYLPLNTNLAVIAEDVSMTACRLVRESIISLIIAQKGSVGELVDCVSQWGDEQDDGSEDMYAQQKSIKQIEADLVRRYGHYFTTKTLRQLMLLHKLVPARYYAHVMRDAI